MHLVIPEYYTNFDLENLVTPVNVEQLESLLVETNYDVKETEFIIQGFRHGFELGYAGPRTNIQRRAKNLCIRVRNETILWNKIMKEVKNLRFAGPFEQIPFKDFIQSPVGLLPKDNGKDTRLIFHLSYPRKGLSINSGTPAEICTVQYQDFSEAIRLCLQAGKFCSLSKSDMSSAFRNLCIRKMDCALLILMAQSPIDGRIYYFMDKCLLFEASISCTHFQRFSNAIAHIVKVKGGYPLINYLDDYLFVALIKSVCNQQTQLFLDICKRINFLVSMEKTVSTTTVLIFLGLLIDAGAHIVVLPVDKIDRAVTLIHEILEKRKVTMKDLQHLTSFLNFICRCIVPGRAFTRRLYSFIKPNMQPFHHIRMNRKIRTDSSIWLTFLSNPFVYCRPFIDFSKVLTAEELEWTTDASGKIGFGGAFNSLWFY